MDRARTISVGVAFAVALLASGCTSASSPAPGSAPAATISQPPVRGVEVAPLQQRVDLSVPTFSDPTNITNPLFPVSQQASVLFLGHVEGEPFRTEVTLLPNTRVIAWEGQPIEALVSQYIAFSGGQIEEVAYDYYAQDDAGSVWYLGEDVFDFRDGAIVVTEGTWLAGRDGPAAMIMPADPQPGDVYRTENAPGFVFEEVTVAEAGRTLDGPLGPVEGGMVAEELHMDGTTERKIFAPGYGEFFTGAEGDVEALAMAVPTDAASGALPTELGTVTDGSLAVVDDTQAGSWPDVAAGAKAVRRAWSTYAGTDAVPARVAPWMSRALDELERAVRSKDQIATALAAIEVARLGYDLQLRYRPAREVDLDRLRLWAAELAVHAAAGDEGNTGADAFILDYTRDRLVGAMSEDDMRAIDAEVGAIQAAIVDQDLAAAGKAASRLQGLAVGPLATG